MFSELLRRTNSGKACKTANALVFRTNVSGFNSCETLVLHGFVQFQLKQAPHDVSIAVLGVVQPRPFPSPFHPSTSRVQAILFLWETNELSCVNHQPENSALTNGLERFPRF